MLSGGKTSSDSNKSLLSNKALNEVIRERILEGERKRGVLGIAIERHNSSVRVVLPESFESFTVRLSGGHSISLLERQLRKL